MKHTIFVLISFSFLLVGCSSNQVTLTMRDGAKIESELLFVRDSAIIIQEKGGAPIAIWNEDVDHVLIDGGSPAPTMVGMGLVGSFLSVLAAGFLSSGCGHCGSTADPGSIVLASSIFGAALGVTTGYFMAPSDKIFFLTNADQLYDLTFYAKYYDTEPDELRKIK